MILLTGTQRTKYGTLRQASFLNVAETLTALERLGAAYESLRDYSALAQKVHAAAC